MAISVSDRKAVRQRANNRCEYCQLPDEIGKFAHHIDHIIPLKHNGSSNLSNLAYACFDCNVFKGVSLAGYDTETGQLTPLYNPRTQTWDDHFTFKSAVIEGSTSFGRVTVFTLQINHPDRVEMRQNLMNAGRW
jgi:5-methylcytosine-specific restriction endonuclease McrA